MNKLSGKAAAGGTPLGRVRGLGSAREGAHHWLAQRVTALANIGLVSWLVVSLVRLDLASHSSVAAWLANPLTAFLLILMVISIFWHLRLGLQVLIEDYLHGNVTRLAALVALNFFAFGGAAFGIFSIARTLFTGTTGA